MTPRAKWLEPQFTRGEVDRAGRLLVQNGVAADALAVGHALDVMNNWRSSHGFPLNTFQVTLRQRSASICEHPIVAQRLKRVPSILAKLQRFPRLKLSRMQDIGGARAVLASTGEVAELRELYLRSRMKHELIRQKDYMAEPKVSGYRSLHLVYRYSSDRKPMYRGLQIELQLRTRLQHAWATAVETVGTFLGQSLKSSEGRQDWLRFFELMGSGFALVEGGPLASNVPDDPDTLLREARAAARRLQVRERLRAYGAALKVIERNVELRGPAHYLLVLDPSQESLAITAYADRKLADATRDYLEMEKSLAGTGGETVLVALDSLESLKGAYPNYFLDTRTFVEEMDSLLS